MDVKSRFLGAVVGALLGLGVVSAGFAYAQTDDGTTDTTEAPAQTAPDGTTPNAGAPDEKDCPLDGQGRPRGQAPAQGSSQTAPAPSADEA